MASKAELASAKNAAEGIISSGVSADEVMRYAGEAKKSAEKYQLYCAAFKLYAKEGNAEDAANVIKMIQSEFIGVSDKDIVLMIEQNAKKLTSENAELGAVLNNSKARASAAQQLSKAKKDLKKNPNSVDLKYLVAESYAVLGDWKSALKQFKDAGGSVWQVASDELAEDISVKTAAFWWDYKPRSKFNAESAFKAHSVEIYEKLLKEGNLSVLEKVSAEKRIEQAASIGLIKPKNELDKLKKICNTKGLVHCWRFNGDLKDCMNGGVAEIKGKGSVEETCVTLPGGNHLSGYIKLGTDLIPTDADEITLEVWAKQISRRHYGRLFCFGSNLHCSLQMVWAGKNGENKDAVLFADGVKENKYTSHWDVVGPFDLGVEYHAAVVLSRKENKTWQATMYKQDVIKGNTISKKTIDDMKGWQLSKLQQPQCYLGAATNDDSVNDSNISYNEVRIWNRALSEEELTQNAIKFHKAGETMKK